MLPSIGGNDATEHQADAGPIAGEEEPHADKMTVRSPPAMMPRDELDPTPPLLFAGVAALWPLAAVVRRPISLPRLNAEALGAVLAVTGLVPDSQGLRSGCWSKTGSHPQRDVSLVVGRQ